MKATDMVLVLGVEGEDPTPAVVVRVHKAKDFKSDANPFPPVLPGAVEKDAKGNDKSDGLAKDSDTFVDLVAFATSGHPAAPFKKVYVAGSESEAKKRLNEDREKQFGLPNNGFGAVVAYAG
jgi:hypothetical protein